MVINTVIIWVFDFAESLFNSIAKKRFKLIVKIILH